MKYGMNIELLKNQNTEIRYEISTRRQGHRRRSRCHRRHRCIYCLHRSRSVSLWHSNEKRNAGQQTKTN